MREFVGVFTLIAKSLGKNSDAALAFAAMLTSLGLSFGGVANWMACGTPVAIYAFYQVSKVLDAWIDMRSALAALDRLERENLLRLNSKFQRKQLVNKKSTSGPKIRRM